MMRTYIRGVLHDVHSHDLGLGMGAIPGFPMGLPGMPPPAALPAPIPVVHSPIVHIKQVPSGWAPAWVSGSWRECGR